MNFNTNKILKGMIAGFVATIVLTILMMMKKMMGVMPALDPVHMMANMVAEKMGMQPMAAIGWVMHFGIGTVAWGGALAIFNNLLPSDSQAIKGVMVGIGAWFLMMIGPMPMGGAGFFGLNISMMAPVMTFMLHIVFGIVMGSVYKKLNN